MSKNTLFRSLAIVALLLLVAGPAGARQAGMGAPEPTLSSEAQGLLDQALAGSLQEDFPLAFRAYTFPSFAGGGSLVMFGFEPGRDGIMFGVDSSAGDAGQMGAAPAEVAKLELFGSLLLDGSESKSIGTTFTVPSTSGDAGSVGVHSFGDNLPAGSYELVWGVRDTVSGAATTRRDTVEVPDYTTAGLTTSGVVLVTGAPMSAPGMFQPNTVYPGLRVLTASFPADLDQELPRSASPVLTFIVVGAQQDPATQAFNLQLTYRILTADGDSIMRVPPQPLDRVTVGQEIPLSQVEGLDPGEDYVFEIGVKDLAGGADATTRVSFTVSG